MDKVITLGVGAIVASTFISQAITQINETNTSGWSVATAGMWGLMSIIVIVATIMLFIKQIQE
jgi:uncharacterized membrane protein